MGTVWNRTGFISNSSLALRTFCFHFLPAQLSEPGFVNFLLFKKQESAWITAARCQEKACSARRRPEVPGETKAPLSWEENSLFHGEIFKNGFITLNF